MCAAHRGRAKLKMYTLQYEYLEHMYCYYSYVDTFLKTVPVPLYSSVNQRGEMGAKINGTANDTY